MEYSYLPSVRLVNRPQANAEDLCLDAMSLCRDGKPTIMKLVEACERGELTLLEHASFTFEITCSTVARTHLLRHRLCSFTERSLRSTEPEFNYFPQGSNEITNSIITDTMAYVQNVYDNLIKAEVPKDVARYILPQGTLTHLYMTANAREIAHIIHLRTSPAALEETREIASKIWLIMLREMPHIFPSKKILEAA